VKVLRSPRYIDESKCIGCGACAEKCPKKVVDAYNEGLAQRKAAYVEYAQAVPLKYRIDGDNCIYLNKNGKCGVCKKICPTGAVDFDQKEVEENVHVGAVVLSPGFKAFDPSKLEDYYHYKGCDNVVTAMEFERILSATGPFQGHLVRPSDHAEPEKIAFLQCVGSRDIHHCDNEYCSSVCCMYAIKEAIIAKEHAAADMDAAIFFMDIRTHGKDFEKYYNRAQDEGVRFVRTRVSKITEDPKTQDVIIHYAEPNGAVKKERFGLAILSVGFETPPEVARLAGDLGVELTKGNFCKASSFAPTQTSRKGVFACGAFLGPRDIPQSVVDSSAAAMAAGEILAPARNSLTHAPEKIMETDISGQRPRVGVFVCKCGTNIAGVVDVPSVAEYAASLPYVEYASDNLYSCSQDTQDALSEIIREKKLNRVVVAACTPKTHEPLFQETLVNAGLNKYLFEMCNIRNQDSWVHKNNPELATEKAMDLVRMAVSKAVLMGPLSETELTVNQTAVIVGGGAAGMTAAKSLAVQGYDTHIIERSDRLGGQALSLHRTALGEDVGENLSRLADDVSGNEKIHVHLNSRLAGVEGFVGNFKSTVASGDAQEVIEHGVTLIATGGSALKPSEYLYGQDPRIVTSLELDKKLMEGDPSLKNMKSAVFIQCVGSREKARPYCSRVCCAHSINNALELLKLNPEMNIYILYRDIRTYGERESLYKEARAKGVRFIRHTPEDKPKVDIVDGQIHVSVKNPILEKTLNLKGAGLVALATAIVPGKNEELAQFFKVPINEDGFFVERHAKLGPSEFATDGVFLCGLAHYPKPMDEAVAQAQAAASRALTLLSRKNIFTSGAIAETEPAKCAECGVCVSVCPYSAPSFIEAGPFSGKAQVNPVLCKGCGLCVASCRSGAIHLKGFDNDQIMAQISAMNQSA
jgi:heterodisulfide reductase subunit A2